VKTVLANGCFDVLHAGHLRHLEAAKAMGDRLVVALTEDAFVNKGPGFPVNAWENRRDLLLGLRCVDEVIPSVNDWSAIMQVRPAVFVKGADYKDKPLAAAKIACLKVGAEIAFTETPKLSSRDIVERLREAAAP
jgi:D-beta-D-heptose 7-phosphate kinase/D-beta-D-heptose 1-phosphate adenosyltransferase